MDNKNDTPNEKNDTGGKAGNSDEKKCNHNNIVVCTQKEDKWTIANTIGVCVAVISGIYMFTTIFIWHEAHKSAKIYEKIFKETQKEFNINNRAELDVGNIYIFRGAWNGRNDTIQLVYKIDNLTEHPVQIDSVKHKWDFDSMDVVKYAPPDYIDLPRDTIDFAMISGFKSVNQSAIKRLWCTKRNPAGFAIYDLTNGKDSAHLDKNLDLLFTEVYYTNVYTKEKCKFLFIGRINGYKSRDSIREVRQIYYSENIIEEAKE